MSQLSEKTKKIFDEADDQGTRFTKAQREMGDKFYG